MTRQHSVYGSLSAGGSVRQTNPATQTLAQGADVAPAGPEGKPFHLYARHNKLHKHCSLGGNFRTFMIC